MNRRKNSGLVDWLADFSVHSILLHPFSLFIAGTAVVLVGAAFLWNQQRDSIANQQFQLTADKINVNAQPDWIKRDIRQAVFRGNHLEEWSLLDHEVVEKVHDAFAVDPWVEKVIRVEKDATGVSVTVTYRKPVALVEFGGRYLLPVDANGVILDGNDFNKSQLNNYLRIFVPQPVGGQIVTGQPWPDARVVAAAQIAAAWQSDWQQAGLYRIANHSPPTLDQNKVGPFEIWSREQTKIIWGNPPGRESKNEVASHQKIAAILADVKQNGGFDKRGKSLFDVRDGRLRRTTSAMRSVSHQQPPE